MKPKKKKKTAKVGRQIGFCPPGKATLEVLDVHGGRLCKLTFSKVEEIEEKLQLDEDDKCVRRTVTITGI